MHRCMGINELKLLHELAKCLLLLWRSRILRRFTILDHTPDVADTHTIGIMPQAMRSSDILGTPLVDAAVAIDYIMIANIRKVASEVPTTNVVHREILSFRCGRTMNDNFSDASHEYEYFECFENFVACPVAKSRQSASAQKSLQAQLASLPSSRTIIEKPYVHSKCSLQR